MAGPMASSPSASSGMGSAKAHSSSSTSPMGVMRGSSTAPAGVSSAKMSRRVRQARRFGSRIVPAASDSGSAASGQPGMMRPARIASASVRRCGREAGIVRTRGRLGMP